MRDIHSVLSPAALLNSCTFGLCLPLWSPPASSPVFLVPCCLLFPQHYRLLQRTLTSRAVLGHLCLQQRSSLIFFSTHSLVFLDVHGVHRALPNILSDEPLFSSPPSHQDTVTGTTRGWVIFILVSNDTALPLEIFPDSLTYPHKAQNLKTESK